MEILQNIGEHLTETFSKAVEAHIAVALVKDYSLSILDMAKNCKVRMIVGINLPTSIEVLEGLRERYKSNARIYLRGDFFHPKVYLFRMKDNSLIAYIGSANFTNSGLNSNIELSIVVTDQIVCAQILEWFNRLYNKSEHITNDFLANYSNYVMRWGKISQKRNEDFKHITENHGFFMDIMQELEKRRYKKNYDDICVSREQDIKDIKKAIDYDHDFKQIDVDSFLHIGALGNIRPAYKNQLKDAVADKSLRRITVK